MERTALLQRGVWLEVATVAWNVIEGVIAVAAGALASSVALIAFGIDSFVETASGAVVGWRLRVGRIAGALLLGLAGYILVDAGRRLLGFGSEPAESRVGIVLTGFSLVVMPA